MMQHRKCALTLTRVGNLARFVILGDVISEKECTNLPAITVAESLMADTNLRYGSE